MARSRPAAKRSRDVPVREMVGGNDRGGRGGESAAPAGAAAMDASDPARSAAPRPCGRVPALSWIWPLIPLRRTNMTTKRRAARRTQGDAGGKAERPTRRRREPARSGQGRTRPALLRQIMQARPADLKKLPFEPAKSRPRGGISPSAAAARGLDELAEQARLTLARRPDLPRVAARGRRDPDPGEGPVGYGHYERWVRERCKFSKRSAENFVGIAENSPHIKSALASDPQRVAD